MMEGKELLIGLQEAQSIINNVFDLEGKLAEQSRYLQPLRQLKWKKSYYVLTALVVFALITSTPLRWVSGIVTIPLSLINQRFALSVLNIINIACSLILGNIFAKLWKKKALLKQEKENSAISEQNARIYEIIDELKQRILPLQKRYAERIAPWYPQNYCSVDAVGFFVDAVQNYRANTVSEAVNLYEDALHKRKMERGQEQIAKQQRISAMLQVGALMMQGATIDAINRNTDAVNNPQFVKDYYKRSSGTSW